LVLLLTANFGIQYVSYFSYVSQIFDINKNNNCQNSLLVLVIPQKHQMLVKFAFHDKIFLTQKHKYATLHVKPMVYPGLLVSHRNRRGKLCVSNLLYFLDFFQNIRSAYITKPPGLFKHFLDMFSKVFDKDDFYSFKSLNNINNFYYFVCVQVISYV